MIDIRKVILSADPALNPNSCVVVAMFYHNSYQVGFHEIKRRAGGSGGEQQRWTYIPIDGNFP